MAAPIKRNVDDNGCVEFTTRKQSTEQSNTHKLKAFIEWSTKNNFQLNDKVTVGREGSCAQFGMVAVDDITEGEILFQIPRKCLLTPDNCAIADCLKKDVASIQGSSGWVPLLISLMHEYNNPQSLWRPYLDLVPDFKELDLPMFWSSTERCDLLQGTGVDEAVNRDLKNIEQEFNEVVLPFICKHEDKFSQVCKDIEFYKRMVAFVMSYSFTERAQQEVDEEEEDSGSSPPMMVPMADILNHVAKNNAHLNFEKEALKMVAVKDIKKGEEVFNTYGELANLHLLHMYGFAEKYPQNHWDTVNIYVLDVVEASKVLDCNKEQGLFEEKRSLVEEVFETGYSITVGITGVLEEQEMKTLLKICCAENEESIREAVEDDWESDDEDTTLEFKPSSEILSNWKLILRKSAELSLQRYTTTLQDDESVLSTSKPPSRQLYSLYTAYGQKQILQKMYECFT